MDELTPCHKMREFDHNSLKQGVGSYVKNQGNTNGLESFWVIYKRIHIDDFHKMSLKLDGLYVT